MNKHPIFEIMPRRRSVALPTFCAFFCIGLGIGLVLALVL